MAEINLTGFTPPARYPPDDQLWEQVRIEETSTPTLDTGEDTIEAAFTLDPAVTDPASPPTYSFTSTNATIGAGGWYRVVWIDENDVEQPTDWVEYVPLPAWAPSVADVAALLRARLYVNGQQHATFDYETRPTGPQVQDLISIATVDVGLRVGDDLATRFHPSARRLTALYVAMLVELTYFPEQTGDENTVYARLKELYDSGLLSLVDVMADSGEGTSQRIGSIPLVSATLSAYEDVYGVDSGYWC